MGRARRRPQGGTLRRLCRHGLPNPDSGEEWYHVNTQLFGTINDHNRGKIGEGVTKPWNAPPPGAAPTMDGFVTDYISTFTGEVGRQPTYEEYAQIMTGYAPAQLPVLSGIAREFGVFGHWFSEVPSQTFMNRSFGRRRHRQAWSLTSRRESGSRKTTQRRSSSGSNSTAGSRRST